MEAKLGMSDYNSYDAYHQDLNLTFHNGISDTSAHYWCLNLVLGRVGWWAVGGGVGLGDGVYLHLKL